MIDLVLHALVAGAGALSIFEAGQIDRALKARPKASMFSIYRVFSLETGFTVF